MGTQRWSLRTRLTSVVTGIVTVGLVFTAGFLTIKAGQMERAGSELYAHELALRQAGNVSKRLETAFTTVRTLSHELGALRATGIADRAVANVMLKSVLEGNSTFVGVWTVWEPNAFDGKDEMHRGQPGHDDSGRFIPYWNRGGGKIGVEPIVDYEKEGAGEPYLLPKRTGNEVVLEPYFYKVAGIDTLMTSLVVPVKHDGKFVGVVGVDIALADLQSEISSIRPYETGYASLISNAGKYIAHHDAARLGDEVVKGAYWNIIHPAVASGQDFKLSMLDETLNTEVLQIYVPVVIGTTKTPWSLIVTMPENKVMAGVVRFRTTSMAIAAVSIIVVCVVLSMLLNRFVIRPLGGEPDDAANIARHVASGDLTTPIRLPETDSRSMMAAIEIMQTNLSGIVTSIRSISNVISTAAIEIAQGNLELSQRTESQAASLEQTAASIEEMASTVMQNAENVQRANTAARAAAETAASAGAVVGNVTKTMSDIAEASARMVDIIDVIDGIAFQTNILALNASLEAARAGVSGRGFAAVASEVRNLAQRSATASREVKDLIESSVSQVNTGTVLVSQVGLTMDRVIREVHCVTGLMTEIAIATNEQSIGINQINEAIMLMDEVTQQNARMVEQAAVAATSLQQQSQQLLGAVGVFQIK
ncbi:methyl-accepting chemotaxis protein [Noviherbaspirillum sp. CPCC 100848]|uniref:Methyl-accepting chemotaxis protein n=1 Tax=Noviherbaspirillum album TaxID=3080276 RepID=A0ABU6JIA3_9BURK|nr:methyl-accepting chemotaxis protein [Noviherbaspirillum sp. CPCC 100848]MEC4722804.1 methyl-accepting chemotaxis protein [Noviherbaspirillum sp. CPCC 100848]